MPDKVKTLDEARDDIEMAYPIYYYVALLSVAALLTRSLYVRISLSQRKRRFARKHGCAPVTRAQAWDPLLGLDHFVRLGKAASQRRYLEYWRKNMFGRYGNTFEINLMGQRLLFTNEPRNIQAVLVTQFPDFDIGQRRRDNSAQLLGVGVFNADGATWEHARATLRPNLTRAQVADLRLFEKHVGVWMAALPEDGQAVDMQEWAFRFVSCAVMSMDKAYFANICPFKDLGRGNRVPARHIFRRTGSPGHGAGPPVCLGLQPRGGRRGAEDPPRKPGTALLQCRLRKGLQDGARIRRPHRAGSDRSDPEDDRV